MTFFLCYQFYATLWLAFRFSIIPSFHYSIPFSLCFSVSSVSPCLIFPILPSFHPSIIPNQMINRCSTPIPIAIGIDRKVHQVDFKGAAHRNIMRGNECKRKKFGFELLLNRNNPELKSTSFLQTSCSPNLSFTAPA